MRVLSVLAVLVAAAHASNIANVEVKVPAGPGSGNVVAPAQAFSSSPGLGDNFVNEVFGGGGKYGGGNKVAALKGGNIGGGFGSFGGSSGGSSSSFGSNNFFGSQPMLGGDIFGSSGSNSGGFGAGFSQGGIGIGGQRQRGRVQTSRQDQYADRSDQAEEAARRSAQAQEQGVARNDEQERQGNYLNQEQDKQQLQDERRAREQNENYNQKAGLWNVNSKRQNDEDKRTGATIAGDGETIRSDWAANGNSKTLGVRKNAFTNGNNGFENIGYNFVKDFDQVANEKGGFKEVTGRDNNNTQLYTEKQRDHRKSQSNSDQLRNADAKSRSALSHESLQNALQKQGQKNKYGAAEKNLDAAGKKAEDFETISNKRNDIIWNADRARDGAYRGAEDVAAKNGLYNKDSIARAHGSKGINDNKYYGGRETGPRTYGGFGGGNAGGYGGGNRFGYNQAGVAEAEPELIVAIDGPHDAAGGYGDEAKIAELGAQGGRGYGKDADRYGLHGGIEGELASIGAPRAAHSGPGGLTSKGRLEKSGGDVVNAYKENAVQGDLSNQLSNNKASSRANAANQYLRDKGLQDKVQLDKQKQGKWANQREGFRDGRQQGYQGDNAEAAKASEAVSNQFKDASSSSNLDAYNKNREEAKLDRINLKRNQVESNQNVRSKKQFYHDKNQGGFNNEGLNYNRKRGNNDFGAQESAQKEAKTKSSNLRNNDKTGKEARRYEEFDGRRLSNGNHIFRKKNANAGDKNKFSRARDDAAANSQGFNKEKVRQEFDRFNQKNSNANQKSWDKANKDFFARNTGNNWGRRTDATFDFGNGFARQPAYSSDGGAHNALGSSRFGATPLGLDGGAYTGANSGAPGTSGYGGRSNYNGGLNQNQNQGFAGSNAYNAGRTQFGGQNW